MLKVEVIFKILEVNFGILVEVICPASKSQDCNKFLNGRVIFLIIFVTPMIVSTGDCPML